MRLAAVLLLVLISPASRGDDILVSQFLSQLSEAHGIRFQGTEILGNDSFEPAAQYRDVESALARALRHFNHVVTYESDRPVLVTILGRKGNDVGALPDNSPEPVTQQE